MTEELAQKEQEDVALAPIEVDVSGTCIEHYGGRSEVRELGDRLMALHPAAAEVGQAGLRAVAQLAILSGASPLPGTNEIHVWKNKAGIIQTTLGINYFRRRARELGGIFWRSHPRQMNVKERQEYLIPEGVIAAICEAVRIEDMLRFRELDFAAQDIFDSVGEVGIATVLSTAHTKQNRPLLWTAFKGAEIDLYRKLFPMLSDTRPPTSADDNGTPQPTERRERSEAEMQEISNGLYGDDDAPGFGDEWDQDVADVSGEGAPEVELPESEPAVASKSDNGKDTDAQPQLADLPEHLAWLAEIEPNQDREDMEWTDFWQSIVQELGFNHGRHASNALKKVLDGYPPDGLSKSQRWAILARHQEGRDEEE